jgi:hypothetical protein
MFSARLTVFALPLTALLPHGAAVAATSESDAFHCTASANESLLDQANRFILATLRLAPVEATQAGYHGDAQTNLDTQLDDSSPEASGLCWSRASSVSQRSKPVQRRMGPTFCYCATVSSLLSFS